MHCKAKPADLKAESRITLPLKWIAKNRLKKRFKNLFSRSNMFSMS